MSKWIDTTRLPDVSQRCVPVEIIGQVFGTAGTPPYIHLQLEMSKRMFGDSIPTLVANDGDDAEAEKVRALAEQYGVEFRNWPSIGHANGDVKIFHESMLWAQERGIDVVAKFSRRFVPLISWRHGLQYLASANPDVCFFTRTHEDKIGGLFRTDAIAYRVRLLDTERVNKTIGEIIERKPERVHVEGLFESFCHVCGGWAMWDLLGPNFYKPWNKAMQWRGLLPYHYGDLARQLDLPYTDIDFLSASVRLDHGDKTKIDEALKYFIPVEQMVQHQATAEPMTLPNPRVQVVQLENGPFTSDPNPPTVEHPRDPADLLRDEIIGNFSDMDRLVQNAPPTTNS